MVRGRVAGSGPSGPGPGQQLAAHAGRVDGSCPGHRKLRRKVPTGGWRLDHASLEHRPSHRARSESASSITVAACQRGSDQRQHLVPSVRPSRRSAEVKVMVDEFPQAQVPGGRVAGRSRNRHWPPGEGRQRGCGYGRVCSVAASIGCSLFPGWFLFQNHYPRCRGAPDGFFKDCPQGSPSVDSGLAQAGPSFPPTTVVLLSPGSSLTIAKDDVSGLSSSRPSRLLLHHFRGRSTFTHGLLILGSLRTRRSSEPSTIRWTWCHQAPYGRDGADETDVAERQ